jgi:M6 family metalloprotease-like protein
MIKNPADLGIEEEPDMPYPFYGEEFGFVQPDGSQIKLKGWGNQNYAVFETLEGYTVIKDPLTGFYQYAKLSADKNYLEPTEVGVGQADPGNLGLEKHLRAARDATVRMSRVAYEPMGSKSRWEERRERTKEAQRLAMMSPGLFRAPPKEETKGEYVGLCIPIQFPDDPGSISQSEIEDFCNKKGYNGFGNAGSVYDYFYDVSSGKLKYTNIVAPYYTAKNSKDYYTNRNIPHPDRAMELIEEAVSDLKEKGFDFSRLSADDEGYIYAVNVFYAGLRTNNWAEGLWPHSYHLSWPYEVGSDKKVYDYQITDMSYELSIATFCHENGHMVCNFPDLYDYGRDDPHNVPESCGVGIYCLMCSGGHDKKNPAQICAYLKYKAGWADKVTPITEGEYIVKAGVNDFLIKVKSLTEYFIIENRFQEGRDSSLPCSGLAIWHVDELGSNDFEDMKPKRHYECSLEQADNLFELEQKVNIGDWRDLHNAEVNSSFGNSTGPSSKWWDGTPSRLEIADISIPGKEMSFKSIKKGINRFHKISNPKKTIPDGDEKGIRDIITFEDEGTISSLNLGIVINHPWMGDLRVVLISPSGVQAVLYNRNCAGAGELKVTLDVSSSPELRNLINLPIKGDWTLWIQDVAESDAGVLNSWSLEIDGQISSVVEVEDISAVKIPDNDPSGIMRSIVVDAPGAVKNLDVSIDITHTYIGDLVITLVTPQGKFIDLQHPADDAHDSLIKIYSTASTPELEKLIGEPIKGKWQLKVADLAAEDMGKLNRWGLKIVPA